MLIQFTVENFKSFKDRTVFSLEASKDKEHSDNYVYEGKDKILKTAALFGANAAGKSNFFSALTAAILLIRKSNVRQLNEPLEEIVPFKFDDASQKKPSFFEFVFRFEGIKYVYGFSATRTKVIEEYLYEYHSSKASTIFERTNENEYRFTSSSCRRDLLPLTKFNAENKLFLATVTAWNSPHTKKAFTWFSSYINTYNTNYNTLFNHAAMLLDNDTDHSKADFTLQMLQEGDINIEDFDLRIQNMSREYVMHRIPSEFQNVVPENMLYKDVKIVTTHSVTVDGKTKQYHLDFNEESQGTRNLFLFSPALKKAFDTGETVFIDEFDSSLHPLLVTHLISLFHNPEVNPKNAQLIISTHFMGLMTLEFLRRDQIYFVEKKHSTAVSELYSLDEFKPHVQENIRKSYLAGRYGSIPFISE